MKLAKFKSDHITTVVRVMSLQNSIRISNCEKSPVTSEGYFSDSADDLDMDLASQRQTVAIADESRRRVKSKVRFYNINCNKCMYLTVRLTSCFSINV